MMKRIGLIAGCSHSAGSEIDGTEDSSYNRDHSFGSLLATKLGYDPVNIAITGATNSGIARSILNWFKNEYIPTEMDVFVVLGWSESNRLEVPSADRPLYYRSGNPNVAWFDDSADLFHRVNYGWNGVTPYEKQMIPQYQKFMAENEFMLEYWALTNVLMIQSYLKSRGIRYIMCNTMHMASKNNPTVESLLDQIDDSRYYMNNSFFPKYRALGYVNEKAKYWHHGEEPHRLFAEELYDFLGYGNDLD